MDGKFWKPSFATQKKGKVRMTMIINRYKLLLSIGQLTASGYDVVFHKDGCRIVNAETGYQVLRLQRNGNTSKKRFNLHYIDI